MILTFHLKLFDFDTNLERSVCWKVLPFMLENWGETIWERKIPNISVKLTQQTIFRWSEDESWWDTVYSKLWRWDDDDKYANDFVYVSPTRKVKYSWNDSKKGQLIACFYYLSQSYMAQSLKNSIEIPFDRIHRGNSEFNRVKKPKIASKLYLCITSKSFELCVCSLILFYTICFLANCINGELSYSEREREDFLKYIFTNWLCILHKTESITPKSDCSISLDIFRIYKHLLLSHFHCSYIRSSSLTHLTK